MTSSIARYGHGSWQWLKPILPRTTCRSCFDESDGTILELEINSEPDATQIFVAKIFACFPSGMLSHDCWMTILRSNGSKIQSTLLVVGLSIVLFISNVHDQVSVRSFSAKTVTAKKAKKA
jgi:hypothetical protein